MSANVQHSALSKLMYSTLQVMLLRGTRYTPEQMAVYVDRIEQRMKVTK